MLKHRATVVLAMLIFGIALTLAISIVASRSVSASDDMTLANKLRDLVAQKAVIGILFANPIEGETKFWAIPDSVGEDKSILRTMDEIGSDYFCVREASEGAIVAKCIPFTNIAQITYADMP